MAVATFLPARFTAVKSRDNCKLWDKTDTTIRNPFNAPQSQQANLLACSKARGKRAIFNHGMDAAGLDAQERCNLRHNQQIIQCLWRETIFVVSIDSDFPPSVLDATEPIARNVSRRSNRAHTLSPDPSTQIHHLRGTLTHHNAFPGPFRQDWCHN
jgi:hypothetical protein